MCGICGIYSYNRKIYDYSLINKMLTKLEHRGPDHEGVLHLEKISLGHRRLSIIDLSEKSNQPMQDKANGINLVFNGAIYNYPELRQQLIAKGHSFFSHGDTEVILRAYQEWGQDCVKHFDGMFAFAIWDEARQQLFLARDRLGIKPLYYTTHNQQFIFASTLTALLVNNVNTDIDPISLHYQFSLHAVIPAPNTIINSIKKLSPGHSLTIKSDGQQILKPYWQLNYLHDDDKKNWSEDDWQTAVEEQLNLAVKKRMTIADVPVGVLLSGGLDSSLLVALLKNQGIENLHTFSIGFSDIGEEKGSEFEFSDQVVEQYKTNHQKIIIPNEDVMTRLPEAIQNMSEPMFGQDAVAFYLLSEQVAKQVKVVQSGQGADELFAGYFWYPQMQKASGTDVNKFAPFYVDREHNEYLQSVQPKYQQSDYTSEYLERYFQQLPDNRSFLSKALHLDITTLIVDDPVKRVDNMTMAWGLEARVPFLDHHLVELVMQMPSKYKVGSMGLKHMLKKISRGKIPDSIIDRPKGYFPMPALKYVRGGFLDMMKDTLQSQACINRGIYDRSYVQRLIDEPEAPENMTRLQGSKLWHMALLELWFQTHLKN
ncbi:MAG: N-acetylglutaminylglutamine amidotransferase [Gammaproteobacteria bacterium]|nr:N-acetylglutaminylglutamine amidotransferase [Gammaproteobacteria bacterium]